MLLKGDEGGVQNWEGVALRVTGTVPLPLGDPSTQRSMNRVVAQQELERQNFRVRGSGGRPSSAASGHPEPWPAPRCPRGSVPAAPTRRAARQSSSPP